MRRRIAVAVAWGSFALSLAIVVAYVAIGDESDAVNAAIRSEETGFTLENVGLLAVLLVFSAIGALVASRRRGNAIGWLLCGVALAFELSFLTDLFYVRTVILDPPVTPVERWVAWFGNWVWMFGFVPTLTFLLLLFPTGSPPSRRWWAVGYLTGVSLIVLWLAYALQPGPLTDYRRVGNPLGVDAFGGLFDAFEGLGFALFAVAALGSALSLVVRFRRARGEERQQLKWVVFAALLLVVNWVGGALLGWEGSPLLSLGLLALAVAVAMAVLRYRLYDIDVVINRTLVYGALTAILGGAYLGGVLLFQLVLSQESGLAVAGSTLAVAALFRPLRARIQEVVDRRFYRHRYDAARTLQSFGGRLRDEVDLDAVGGELRGVAREALQPAHVSLWLRAPEASR